MILGSIAALAVGLTIWASVKIEQARRAGKIRYRGVTVVRSGNADRTRK